MARSNLGRRLAERVEARINQLAVDLASGNAPTFDAYKYYVGMASGMREAMSILDDLERDQD